MEFACRKMSLALIEEFLLGFLLLYAITGSLGESSTCLTLYKEGGAPAVFRSPKCPLWKLPNYESRSRATTTNPRCQSAMLQGRRKSLEDRTLCVLDLLIPFPGRSGSKEVEVGIVAVFDGHNGAEASEMASKLLLEYFLLHTYFLLDATYSFLLKKSTGMLPNRGHHDFFRLITWDEEFGRYELNFERLKFSEPANFDDSFHLEILKKALLRAIHDIDATFSKEASRSKVDSGSTATIVLIADGKILVANIGDSKAFLCSKEFLPPAEAKATLKLYKAQRRNGAYSPLRDIDFKLTTSNGLTRFSVKELTKDHHPNRDDERVRVEAAGGYVHEWGGVPRVNGELAISRAIGDVSFKSYGVIAAPEITDWRSLTINDSFLVAASDGVFEKLSLQNVCDLLWEVNSHGSSRSELSLSCAFSLADCLVNTAFENGSMDNIAAIVVPLDSYISDNQLRENDVNKRRMDTPTAGQQKLTYELSPNINSDLTQLKNAHPVTTKFNRLLVEGKHNKLCSFYLSENLKDDMDETLPARKAGLEDHVYDLPNALPGSLEPWCGGSPDLYSGQNSCLHFGMNIDGTKDQCINPEGFPSFLSLLESIPFEGPDSVNGSIENATPDSRYLLKRMFGRGSYGEVWLAFHWNYQQDGNASSHWEEVKNISSKAIPIDPDVSNSHNNTFNPDGYADFADNLFILKRIMAEKGHAVSLSGLREKHFGEVFLNASICLRGLQSAQKSSSFMEETVWDLYDLETNHSTVQDSKHTWHSNKTFSNRFSAQRATFDDGLNHIARYVESFESRSSDMWLVFRHEGVSLSKVMYTVEEAEDKENIEEVKHFQVLHPSKWWHWLKTTDPGKREMRNLIWQLLLALKSCHDRNITHRDIKPENMVICFEDQETGRCLKGVPSEDKNFNTKMRIIDFGSAIDEFTLQHLYGSTGPSRAEETHEYAPPEAILNRTWYQGGTRMTLKYDMWSVGVVILELITGTPNIFQISAKTRALLDHHLEGWNQNLKELAYKLRSYMELCILIPGSSSKHPHTVKQGGVSPASWKCSEEFFSFQIKSKDPLKLGFPNIEALRLVRDLLVWNPEDRLSIDDALQHPYFHPPTPVG